MCCLAGHSLTCTREHAILSSLWVSGLYQDHSPGLLSQIVCSLLCCVSQVPDTVQTCTRRINLVSSDLWYMSDTLYKLCPWNDDKLLYNKSCFWLISLKSMAGSSPAALTQTPTLIKLCKHEDQFYTNNIWRSFPYLILFLACGPGWGLSHCFLPKYLVWIKLVGSQW